MHFLACFLFFICYYIGESASGSDNRGIRRTTDSTATPNTFDIIIGTDSSTTTYQFASGDDLNTGFVASDNNNLVIREYYEGATDTFAYLLYSGTNVDGQGTGATATVSYSGDYIIAPVPAAGQTAAQAFAAARTGTISFDLDYTVSAFAAQSNPIENPVMMDSARNVSATFGTAQRVGRQLLSIDFDFQGSLSNFADATVGGILLGANYEDFAAAEQITETISDTATTHVFGITAGLDSN